MAVPKATKRMKSVPNILTLCRIFTVPLLVALLSFPTPLNRALATLLFILASVLLVANTLMERPLESLLGLVFIAAGLPAYAWWRRQATANRDDTAAS